MTIPWADEQAPFVYDSSGSFLQLLGSVGDGPGEYRRPTVIAITDGDTVNVFDRQTGRLTVLSELEFVRSEVGVVRISSAVQTEHGALAVNNARFPGQPLSYLDRNGQPVRSFGPRTPAPIPPDEYLRIRRVLAPTVDGQLWSARQYFKYELTLWDSTGTAVRTLSPDADWFPNYDSLLSPSPGVIPSPSIKGALVDNQGHIWILGSAASVDWTAGLGGQRTVENQTIYEVTDWSKVYDGIIDVIDAADGTHVDRLRLERQHLLLAIAPGYFGAVRETPLGWILIDVYRVDLVD